MTVLQVGKLCIILKTAINTSILEQKKSYRLPGKKYVMLSRKQMQRVLLKCLMKKREKLWKKLKCYGWTDHEEFVAQVAPASLDC